MEKIRNIVLRATAETTHVFLPFVFVILLLGSVILNGAEAYGHIILFVLFFGLTFFTPRKSFYILIATLPWFGFASLQLSSEIQYLIEGSLIGVSLGFVIDCRRKTDAGSFSKSLDYLSFNPVYYPLIFACVYSLVSISIGLGELWAYASVPLSASSFSLSVIKSIFYKTPFNSSYSLSLLLSCLIWLTFLTQATVMQKSLAISRGKITSLVAMGSLPVLIFGYFQRFFPEMLTLNYLEQNAATFQRFDYFGVYCGLIVLIAGRKITLSRNVRDKSVACVAGLLAVYPFLEFLISAAQKVGLDRFAHYMDIPSLLISGYGFGSVNHIAGADQISSAQYLFIAFGYSICLVISMALLRHAILYFRHTAKDKKASLIIDVVTLFYVVFVMFSGHFILCLPIMIILSIWFLSVVNTQTLSKKTNSKSFMLLMATGLFALGLGGSTIEAPQTLVSLERTTKNQQDWSTGELVSFSSSIFKSRWEKPQCVKVVVKPAADSTVTVGLLAQEPTIGLRISDVKRFEEGLIFSSKRKLIGMEWNTLCVCMSNEVSGKFAQQCVKGGNCFLYLNSPQGQDLSWTKKPPGEAKEFYSYSFKGLNYFEKEDLYSKVWPDGHQCQDLINLR